MSVLVHLFHGRGSPLSQWHPSPFWIGGDEFPTAEHWMMWAKARLFGDSETADEIRVAPTPAAAKRLGRRVARFDEAVWRVHRERIVLEGTRAKFTQSPSLRRALLDTAPAALAEASPADRVWGIGLPAGHPDSLDPGRWRGQNLLGRILRRVRDDLLAAERGGLRRRSVG